MKCFQDNEEAVKDFEILKSKYGNENTAKTILLKNNGNSLKYDRNGNRSQIFNQILLAVDGDYEKALMLKSAIYYGNFIQEPTLEEVYPNLKMKKKDFQIKKASELTAENLKNSINEIAWKSFRNAIKNNVAKENLGQVTRTQDHSIWYAEKPKVVADFINKIFSKQKDYKILEKVAKVSTSDPNYVIIKPTDKQLVEMGNIQAAKLYDNLVAQSMYDYINTLHETSMEDVHPNIEEDPNLIDYDIISEEGVNPEDQSLNNKILNFIKFRDQEIGALQKQLFKLYRKRGYAKTKEKLDAVIKDIARVSARIEKLKSQNAEMNPDGTIGITEKKRRVREGILGYGLEELSDVRMLLSSNNSDEILFAKEIIDWYTTLGEFGKSDPNHPLFVDNTRVIDEKLKEDLKTLAETARKYEDEYYRKIKNLVYEKLRSHPNFDKLGLDITKDDLFSQDIPDIDWFSEQVLNPYYQYGKIKGKTQPDLIPQLIVSSFIKNAVVKDSYAKETIEEINAHVIALSKKLGNDYNIFYQKEGEELTGKIVNAFSPQWYSAMSAINKETRKILSKATASAANSYKYKSLKAIGDFLDLKRIPEIAERFEERKIADQSYKKLLIEKYGIHTYNKLINEQIILIEQYIGTRRVIINDLLTKHQVENIYTLPKEEQRKLTAFDLENSPYNVLSAKDGVASVKVKGKPISASVNCKYIKSIPKESLENKFLDKNFDIIKNDEQLHNFWNTLSNALEYINNIIVEASDESVHASSLLEMNRTITEDLLNKKIRIRDRLVLGISSKTFDNYAEKDDTSVNTSVLKSLETRINSTYKKYYKVLDTFALEGGTSTVDPSKQFFEKSDSLEKFLKAVLSPKDFSTAMKGKLSRTDARKLLYNSTRKYIMDQQSFDLPKMVKYYLAKAARVDAQVESIPMLNAMKTLYKAVKTPEGEVRSRANARLESYFNRIIRGYNPSNTGSHTKTNITMRTKEQMKEFQALIEARKQATSLAQIQSLDEKIAATVRSFDMGILTNSAISFVMFVGLAYNISAGIANRMYAVFIGSMEDRRGERWTPGNNQKSYNFVTKKDLKIAHKILGTVSGKEKSYAEELTKAELFMSKLGIIQDMRNEMQKASRRLGKEDFGKKMNPFYISITKPEWQNQTQIILNILQDIKVKDKDNNEYPFFDGKKFTIYDNVNLDNKKVGESYIKDGKKVVSKGGKLVLKPEFDTPENHKNWIRMVGKDFLNFYERGWDANLAVNGDYSEFGGLKVKEGSFGRLMSVFLTYMGMYFNRNYGAGVNLATGVYRDRSIIQKLTPIEVAMLSGFSGLVTSPYQGILTGLAFGGISKALVDHAHTELSGLRQLALSGKLLSSSVAEAMVQIGTLGKLNPKLVNVDKLSEKYEIPEQDIRDRYSIARAIGVKTSALIMLLSAILIGYCNDDSEKCKKRKATMTFFVNFLSNLMESLTPEFALADLANSVLRRGPIMRDYDRIITITGQIQDYLDEEIFGIYKKSNHGSNNVIKRLEASGTNFAIPSILRTTGAIGDAKANKMIYYLGTWQKLAIDYSKSDEEKASDIRNEQRDKFIRKLSKKTTREQAVKKANIFYPTLKQIKAKLKRGRATSQYWEKAYQTEIKRILKKNE